MVQTATSDLKEPEEKTVTEDAPHSVLNDPILSAPTVDRDYSQGFKSAPGSAPIPEPQIQAPNFEEPTASDNQPLNDSDFLEDAQSSSRGSKSSKDTEEDPDDEFGFELNGETAVYLIDFFYAMFKNQYKITEDLLVKHGLEKEAFQARIVVEGQHLTVAELADQLNAMMDTLNISVKDKNQIKKIIVYLSKKHDVKMTPEAQLFVVLGKIGFETHIAMKSMQVAFLEKVMGMVPDNSARAAEAQSHEAPDLDQVAREASAPDEPIIIEEVKRKKGGNHRNGSKNGSRKKGVIILENLKEPGESSIT